MLRLINFNHLFHYFSFLIFIPLFVISILLFFDYLILFPYSNIPLSIISIPLIFYCLISFFYSIIYLLIILIFLFLIFIPLFFDCLILFLYSIIPLLIIFIPLFLFYSLILCLLDFNHLSHYSFINILYSFFIT